MADDPSIPNVWGWDASDYDWARGPMDLGAAHADGIRFFTHKATEATWTRHTHYGEAMRRARDAGIPILGAYHVVRSPANAAAEVDYHLSYVDAQTPWWRDWPHWFWQVDLEKWSYDSVPASEGEGFADIIEARTGRKAIIYASRGQYGDQLTGTSHDLWNANYGTNPTAHYREVYAMRGGDSGPGWVTYSGRMPIFWQFGSRTTIGTQGICDANAYRGTLDQLRALISQTGDDMSDAYDLLNTLDRQEGNNTYTVPRYGSISNAAAVAAIQRAEFDSRYAADRADEIKARLEEFKAPAPAPVDAATIKAVLLDPQVLAAIAKAVTDEIGS